MSQSQLKSHPFSTPSETSLTETKAGKLLKTAHEIVNGARNTTHGNKERSFDAIAYLWSAYISIKFEGKEPPFELSGADVAHMMVLMKMMRTQYGTPIEDHWIDMAGYAAIAGELECSTT